MYRHIAFISGTPTDVCPTNACHRGKADYMLLTPNEIELTAGA
jgi:hypothetical protein